MATATKALTDLPKTVTTGAKRVVAPASLATVAGFASSRLLETSLYSAFRGTFGDNSAEGGLTSSQRTARTVAKVGLAVLAGGMLIPAKNANVRAAGVGLMAGATWHALNDFGINV